MTDPRELWPKALDCLRTMPGVQGVADDWQKDGSTAPAIVDRSGTVYHEGTGKDIIRAVIINDLADLPDQIASLIDDFRNHIAAAGLPPSGYIRGDGVNDPTIFSSPLLIDAVPCRIMALGYRIRSRWLVTLDTFIRSATTKPRKRSS